MDRRFEVIAMQVALVGLPQSGKTTLFSAVAEAGGSHLDLSRPDQPHLAVVKVPDPRVDWLAELYKPKKTTLAELEFLDLPGFDLRDEAGRNAAKQHWSAMRQSDMLVLVLRAFEDASVPPYRNRVDPRADLDELMSEMLFADLEQVTNRIERLEAALRKPTGKADEQKRELDLMGRMRDALEAERPISEVIASQAEDKLVRSFAFLSQKPALVVLNVGEDHADKPGPETMGPYPALQLSARIEQEIAQLDPAERDEWLSDMGISAAARDRLIQACYAKLDLISFLTAGEDECRAWTIPSGTDAVGAADEIHSDIARGFIRAETVSFEHLEQAGDMKGVKAAGHLRLEGKGYTVQDGDIINFRFNV